MKQGWKLRRLIAAIGLLSLSLVAWGCGQAAPTAVDLNDGSAIQTQAQGADVTDGTEPGQWN